MTPRGCIFHGTQANPTNIQRALASYSSPILPPAEYPINDSKAHKVMVIYSDGWQLIPSQDPFSRHSGTCLILGDKKMGSPPYKVNLGDCFRLGSVGVVVSEIKTENGEEERLDANMLQYLKDEALAFDAIDDMATLAVDDEHYFRESYDVANAGANDKGPSNDSVHTQSIRPHPDHTGRTISAEKSTFGSGGMANGERFICYMCYETHDTIADPLIAPCDCKGDTRYLHVQCLQKWYHSSNSGPQSRVIRTTGTGAPACKICGVAYRTTIRKPDGKKGSILEVDSTGPHLSLVVVTRHDTNPGLFNTKFRMNFGNHGDVLDAVREINGTNNCLLVGRSSSCHMVLDYRTVSTVHASITYDNGSFFIQDRDSSNGTMVYVKETIPLKYSQTHRFRMGRTTIQLQPKRSWTAALRNVISSTLSHMTPFSDPDTRASTITGSGMNNNHNSTGSLALAIDTTAPSSPTHTLALAPGSSFSSTPSAATVSPASRRVFSFSGSPNPSPSQSYTNSNGKIPSAPELQNIMFSCHNNMPLSLPLPLPNSSNQSLSPDKPEGNNNNNQGQGLGRTTSGDNNDNDQYNDNDNDQYEQLEQPSPVTVSITVRGASLRELTIPEVSHDFEHEREHDDRDGTLTEGVPADSPLFDSQTHAHAYSTHMASSSSPSLTPRSPTCQDSRSTSNTPRDFHDHPSASPSSSCKQSNSTVSAVRRNSIMSGNNEHDEILHLANHIDMKNSSDNLDEDEKIPKTSRITSKENSSSRLSTGSPLLSQGQGQGQARLSPRIIVNDVDGGRISPDLAACPAVMLTVSSAFSSPKEKTI